MTPSMEEIRGAVARGWCHEENSHKVMDCDLAEAISQEVVKLAAENVPLSSTTTPDFDDWWQADGKFFDPDTDDVPWFDKRKELAEYAYQRGRRGHWMQAKVLRVVLRGHWLSGIECDHDTKRDFSTCACGLWASNNEPSVGAAVNAWIEHVFEKAEAGLSPQETTKK
jgi:hypothetical protein